MMKLSEKISCLLEVCGTGLMERVRRANNGKKLLCFAVVRTHLIS